MDALAVQTENSSGFYGGEEKQNGNIDNMFVYYIRVRIRIREAERYIIESHKQNAQEGTETDKQAEY